MRAVIQPGKLQGEIDAIVSKSSAHRMLICASMDPIREMSSSISLSFPRSSLTMEPNLKRSR